MPTAAIATPASAAGRETREGLLPGSTSRGAGVGLSTGSSGDDLNLFRKRVSGRQLAVAVYEDAADDEHRIVRRRNLLHAARHLSFPTEARDQIVGRLRTCGALADVGENSVVRSRELHAVIASR